MSEKHSHTSAKKNHTCEITERDYKLLRFLWRWKAASTRALAKKFFPEWQPVSAYRRLIFLENDGYIKTREVEGRRHEVWVIGERGFKYIQQKLGDLAQVGYKSENIYHDFISTAFHLGEWMSNQPDDTENYSEQQLRRISMEAWPEWVPKSETHRPDGYSIYTTTAGTVTVAFETELWIKARRRYESLVAFYDCQESIQLVFWLIDSKITLNALKKSFQKFHIRYPEKHHFILLSDFKEKGWMAPFIDGKYRGKTVADLLCPNPITSSSLQRHCSDALLLLDSRKKPINSNTSTARKKSENN